jgi:ribosome-associated heat shock protein Hsp15
VREGDVVELYAGERFRKFVMKGIPDRQQAKETARAMYVDETPKQDVEIAPRVSRDRGLGRPTKKDRRDIEKVRS